MKTLRPPVLLVLAVLALHLLAGREVLRLQDGWVSDATQAMPARMQIEFVQEMAPAAPPRAVRMPSSRPTSRPAPPAGMRPADTPPPAASAVEPEPTPARPPELQQAVPVTPAQPDALPGIDTPNDADAGPEWPLSTRLSYELTGNYRGPVSGQAQVEWLRKGLDYQVHLDVGIGPSFAPLITRRMSSQGRLTPLGIAPRRYDELTQVVFADPRRFSQAFLGGDAPMPPGMGGPTRYAPQDAASQFVQLTWLFLTGRESLEPGRVVSFQLRLPSGNYDWQYELVGEEQLDTPLGPLAAWHLKPRQAARGGDLVADVWLAPSLQFLPVRLLIRQDANTFVDLVLKSAPLQAAPESANDTPRRPPP